MKDAGKIIIFKGLSTKERTGRIIFFILSAVIIAVVTFCSLKELSYIGKTFPGFIINPRIVVTNLGRVNWPGLKAGLKYPDKILKVNNLDVSSVDDFEAIINKINTGEPVTYHIERGGQVIEVTVPTMRYSLADFMLTSGIMIFTGFIYLLIGAIVYILKPDTKVSWIFFLACFFMSLINTIATVKTLSIISRTYLFFTPFVAATVVHLSLLFPEKKEIADKYPKLQYLPYIIAASLGAPAAILYPNLSFVPFYKYTQFYLGLSPFLLLASTLWAFIKKSSVIARQRAKVLFLGTALALPVPAILRIISLFPSTIGIPRVSINYLNFLNFPILIFPVSIAFAIAKHNLFDVDVYIKRTVGYGLMTAMVGTTYFIMQLILKSFILAPILGEFAEKVYPVLFAILVVFFFNPVNRMVQGIVDKLFYRKKLSYKDTILSVSNALTSVLNMDEIIKRIIYTLRKEMFIDKAGVILLEPQKECKALFISDVPDTANDQVTEQCLRYDDPLLSLISREKKLITEYDISEDPKYSSVRESCSRRFAEIGASIVIPLNYKEEVIGVLALGNKKSGHFYSREDIDLLETLSNQGAVAIENAKLAEQMKKEETIRTNLARYLSPQIVDDIVKKDMQIDLGGDRKVVTVLFSDIRNFTSITESRPADDLVNILNEYFTEMADIIFENQGSLDKYIGDAIIAVFGSLITVENPVLNAVQTGISMMKRMPGLNEQWMKKYGFSMHMGIGINTGEVFLGNIGSPERMEFTVIGDTVNVASRFSGLAKAGQILMTRESKTFLKNSDIQYNELPPSKVKGKSAELEVFEVLYD